MPDISNFITEVPIGTKNGVNRVFSLTKEPRAVVLDGLWYFEGQGYSKSDLVITMDTNLKPATTSYFLALQKNVIGYSSSSPIYIQDSGNLSFGLSVIITLMTFVFIAFIYNSFTKKKKWS